MMFMFRLGLRREDRTEEAEDDNESRELTKLEPKRELEPMAINGHL